MEQPLDLVAGTADGRQLFAINLVTSTQEILSYIASALSIEDFRNFRLVSKTFLKSSMELWVKSVALSINFNSNADKKSKGGRIFDCKKHEKIIQSITPKPVVGNKLDKFSYRNIEIADWYIWTEGLNNKTVTEFFEKWGPSIQCLILNKCRGPFEKQTFEMLLKLEQLTTIAFTDCNVFPQIDYLDLMEAEKQGQTLSTVPIKLVNIEHLKITNSRGRRFDWVLLQNFPCLKNLTISVEKQLSLTGLLKALKLYRRENGFLYVKLRNFINFDGTIDDLLEAILPLEAWTVNGGDGDGHEPPLPARLEANANKLGELWLSRYYLVRPIYMQSFPFHIHLPALLKLTLIGSVTTSLNFLNYMPALESVAIRHLESVPSHESVEKVETKKKRLCLQAGDFWENTLLINRFILMEKLTRFDVDCRFKLESLKELREVMPNLRILSTILKNDTFRFVCENWPNLTKLTLDCGSTVDDNGIIGAMRTQEKDGDETQTPNLTSLKCLESFEIKRDLTGHIILTDACVLHAFLRMSQLENLVISIITKISDQSRELLKETIKHVDIQ